MDNINKYLIILESVKLPLPVESSEKVAENLEIIKKYIKECPFPEETTLSIEWTYARYLLHIIAEVKRLGNFSSDSKDDLLSMKQMQSFYGAIRDASLFGLRRNLSAEFRSHAVFKTQQVGSEDEGERKRRLNLTANCLIDIFEVRTFLSNSALDAPVLDLMAALVSCVSNTEALNHLWAYGSKEKFFKNLLILKANPKLPSAVQMHLHRLLLDKLQSPGGFLLLVQNVCLQSGAAVDNVPDWRKFEVIAGIVANSVQNASSADAMIAQIVDFVQFCLMNEDYSHLVPAGVVSLKKLHGKHKALVASHFERRFSIFCSPEDVLTGTVLADNVEFANFTNLIFTCFGSSGVASLPSEILVAYIPVLLNLYHQLSAECSEKNKFKVVIVNILANRSRNDLKSILEALLCQKGIDAFKFMHPRVVLRFNDQLKAYSVQICPEELQNGQETTTIITEVLKSSNNNILVYNVFVSLLHLLDSETQEASKPRIDLLSEQEDFDHFITSQFKARMSIVSCLTDLISFRNFHSQFHENPNEILDFLKSSLQVRLQSTTSTDASDQTLSLSLAVLLEIVENSQETCLGTEKYKPITDLLKKFLEKCENLAIKHQIRSLLCLIDGDASFAQKKTPNFEKSPYQFARSLMEESESHLMVYGMQQMIKLLADKDEEALANKNAILALAMHALRDEESYTYLNCVRLLVALMNVLEADVLDVLSGEYLNDDEKIEMRLKVGEAMVKVTEELGPLSYNYKHILINCFLHGCRHPTDEIRCSSFSNLGTVCKLLSYQVHNFFEELLGMISSAIDTEKYLPAKRSAAMVLSQLLWGIDNLMDFQDLLLPMLRLLKYIIANDNDPVTRVHASNAMASLNAKCKAFLFPEEKREFKISLDINAGSQPRSKSKHILELN